MDQLGELCFSSILHPYLLSAAPFSSVVYSKFPYTTWDSIAYTNSLVMTGLHAVGMPQVLNPSYTDKASGGLALAHWRALTNAIPEHWRGNPHAEDCGGHLPLQIIECSGFGKLMKGVVAFLQFDPKDADSLQSTICYYLVYLQSPITLENH